jgi:hypothetical protein
MSKYRLKFNEFEAVSFDELVAHGIASGANVVHPAAGGRRMPWAFEWQGQHVTHENDDCYLVGEHSVRFNRGPDMLVSTPDGDVDVMEADLFNEYMERA